MQREEEEIKAAKPQKGGKSSKVAKKARQKAAKAAAVATDHSADVAAAPASAAAGASQSKVDAVPGNGVPAFQSPAAPDSMREDQQAAALPEGADSMQDDPQSPQEPTLQAAAPQHEAQEAAPSAAAWMLCPIAKVRSTVHPRHSVIQAIAG